ncbi:MAG: ATP synthase subunit I [Burkholderiales bacterium]|nr:ATP synthase subunit I [Burkholderiales bacterium]
MTRYNSARSALYKYMHVVKLQIYLWLLCLAVAVLSLDVYVLMSAFFGGALVVLPTLVYIRVAKVNRVLPAGQVFAKHQKAELFKFFTNLIGFALVFILFKKVHVLALFATYVVTLSSYWFSLYKQAK